MHRNANHEQRVRRVFYNGGVSMEWTAKGAFVPYSERGKTISEEQILLLPYLKLFTCALYLSL